MGDFKFDLGLGVWLAIKCTQTGSSKRGADCTQGIGWPAWSSWDRSPCGKSRCPLPAARKRTPRSCSQRGEPAKSGRAFCIAGHWISTASLAFQQGPAAFCLLNLP